MTDKHDFKSYTSDLQKRARLAEDWYSRICDNLEKCPFCDLRSKYVIAEDGDWVLTVNLFPYTEGHLLIIPRQHIEAQSQMKESDWRSTSKLLSVADSLLREKLDVRGYNFILREGKHGGKSLGHLHFHIIPFEDGLVSWNYQEIEESPQETAQKLRKFLSNER